MSCETPALLTVGGGQPIKEVVRSLRLTKDRDLDLARERAELIECLGSRAAEIKNDLAGLNAVLGLCDGGSARGSRMSDRTKNSRSSAATSASLALDRPTRTTLKPALASLRAKARPMSPVGPVMTGSVNGGGCQIDQFPRWGRKIQRTPWRKAQAHWAGLGHEGSPSHLDGPFNGKTRESLQGRRDSLSFAPTRRKDNRLAPTRTRPPTRREGNGPLPSCLSPPPLTPPLR